MPNLSQEKARWLRTIAGDARTAYGKLSASGTLVLVLEDGREVGVVFPKSLFAHLCGFEYYEDKNKTRYAKQEKFFDDIVSLDFPVSHVDYSHRHSRRGTSIGKRRENTGKKVEIAASVFENVDNAEYIVESAKSGIVIFAGTREWALGLAHQKNKRGERLGTFVPISLLKTDVLSPSVCRSGKYLRVFSSYWR